MATTRPQGVNSWNVEQVQDSEMKGTEYAQEGVCDERGAGVKEEKERG